MYIIYTISCGTMVKHPPLHSLMTSLNKIMTSKLCAVSSSILKYRKCQISTDHFSVYRKQKYIITDKKHVMKNGKKDRPHRPLAFCNSQNRPNWLSGTHRYKKSAPWDLWHSDTHGIGHIGPMALCDTRPQSAIGHSKTQEYDPISPQSL